MARIMTKEISNFEFQMKNEKRGAVQLPIFHLKFEI